jgi:hypothetical protein
VSDNANQLVDHLTDRAADWEIRYGRRKKHRRAGFEKLRTAVTGLLGDLLLARVPGENANGWVYRSLQAQGFTRKRVSHRTFASLVDAVKDLGLVEHKEGVNFWGPGFDGGQGVNRRFAARLRATSKLLKVCREHGITDANTPDHFIEGLPEEPLVLRASSRRVSISPDASAARVQLLAMQMHKVLDGNTGNWPILMLRYKDKCEALRHDPAPRQAELIKQECNVPQK